MDKQNTLQNSISISGVGMHSGVKSNIRILPAEENHGIKFKRIDIAEAPIIDASIDYVSDTERGTTISKENLKIKTVEHILAALYGNNIDNALIEIDSEEVPILDGSAKEFSTAIQKAGVKRQQSNRLYYEVTEPITFKSQDTNSSFVALPSNKYTIDCSISFQNNNVFQYASIDDIGSFNTHISQARTFCFLSEIKHLLDSNLIKGGHLNNALVIIDQDLSEKEKDYLKKIYNLSTDISTKQESKVLGTNSFHYENELARHKLLDIIGDLALLGRPLKAHIIANKPGHRANTLFAKELKSIFANNDYKNIETYIPKYDTNKSPIFDTKQIFNILPQKPPFLMIDKVVEITNYHIIGIKNTTINEDFYKGHFPNEPVMPGVLQIEAMAQTAGILTYHLYKHSLGAPTYLAKVDEVKFKRKIVPGDTLLIYCTLKKPMKRGIIYMKSKIFVGNEIASEGTIVAKIEL